MEDEGKVVPLVEVFKQLDAESKNRELGYEQKLALSHAQQFSRLTQEDSEKLRAELMKSDRVSEALAFKIVEILPMTPDDIRVIFAKERHTLEPTEVSAILEAVKKFA